MWWWGEQEADGAKKWLADTSSCTRRSIRTSRSRPSCRRRTASIPAFKAAAAAKKGPDIQYFWGGIWSLEDAWADNTKPVSDYIPRSELRHYLNAKEDTSAARSGRRPGTYSLLFRSCTARTCWEGRRGAPRPGRQMLEGLRHAKREGNNAVRGGIKDGWFGGWLYSIIGAQGVCRSATSSMPRPGSRNSPTPKHARLVDPAPGDARPQVLERRHQLARALPGQDRWRGEGSNDGHGRLRHEEVRRSRSASRRSA